MSRHAQQGATLIVSMIFLVILIIVGLSSLSTSTYEIKTAQSVKSEMEVFNLAEDGLRQGERVVCIFQLNSSASTGDSSISTNNCNGGFAGFNNWSGGYNTPQLNNKTLAQVAALVKNNATPLDDAQRIAIEYFGTVIPDGNSVNMGQGGAEKRYLFRVTGYANPTGGGHKVVQSYFMTTD